jgi:CxxC-x17-CxxC domain-containing protein
MGDFDRNAGRGRSGRGRFDRNRGGFDRRGGGRDRGGDRGGFDRRDRRSERHEMHSAICDKCGKDCEVPFRPTSGKPLYCDDCYKSKSREAGSRSEFGKQSGKASNEYHDQINKKPDRILKTLEGPIIEKEEPKVKKPKKTEEVKKEKTAEKEEPVLEYAEDIKKKLKKKKAKKNKS